VGIILPNFIVGYYQGAQQPDDDFFLTTFHEWNGCVRVIQTIESDLDREILLLLFFKVLPIFVKLTPDEIAARKRGRMGGRPKIPKDDIEAALKMYDSKSFTLAEIEMRTGVKRPTLYLYLNRRKNGEL